MCIRDRFRVIADFGFFRVQYQAGLCKIGHGIFLDLFACQWRTGDISSTWITNHRCEITDQEYHDMSEILQLAHFIQYNRMTQMQIRCSRIQPQLDTERFSRFFGTGEFLGKFGFDQEDVYKRQVNISSSSDSI